LKKIYEKIEDYLSGSLIVTGLSILFVGVLFRYFLKSPLSWADEVANYLIVWGILIGTAVALRNGHHIQVDVFYDRVSPKMKKIFDTFSSVLGVAFCSLLLIYSIQLILMYFQTQQTSLQIGIELWKVYLVLPITALMLGYRFIERLIDSMKGEID